jgi:hypothetical protein
LRDETQELRRQLEDARHELARAEQLQTATREAVFELDRQLAKLKDAMVANQTDRPKRLRLSDREWPNRLRRADVFARLYPEREVSTNDGSVETEQRTAPEEHRAPGDEWRPVNGEAHCEHADTQPSAFETTEMAEPALLNDSEVEFATSSAAPEAKSESFFSRFQHLLKPDEPGGDGAEPPAASAQAYASVPEPEVMAAPQPRGEDDDSIESYMSRLLQRVRGDASSSPILPATGTVPPAVICNEQSRVDTAPQVSSVPLRNLEEIKAAPAPERSWNMAALRDLANQTAHSAIQTATLRQKCESALIKLVISVLGIICGLVVMKLSPSYTSPEFISGLVPLCAGVVWACLSVVLLLRAIRDGSLGDADELEPIYERVPPDVSADEL